MPYSAPGPFLGAQTAAAYQISRSLRFRSSASAYLSRTFTTPTDNKKWSMSMWAKRGVLGSDEHLFSSYTDGNNYFDFRFNSSNQLYVQNRIGASNLLVANTTAVYRDPSAWYHILFVFDSANATAAYRNRIYVNGIEYSLSANSGSGDACAFNKASATNSDIGVSHTSGLWGAFDGYLAEVNFIDGQALTPSSFGAFDTNGVWQPAKYTGSYGTNGYYLNFSDNSGATATTIGKDSSGNSNNWTPNNISVTSGTTYDSMIDSPTNYADGGNGRGNYAVLNPLIKTDSGSANTMSEGNLRVNCTSNSYGDTSFSSIFVSSGKWYAEFTLSNSSYPSIEIFNMNYPPNFGSSGNGRACLSPYGYGYLYNGNKQNNSSPSAYGSALAVGDVIGVALDMDNGKVWFSKNGTWQASGDPAAGTNAAFTSLSGNFAIGICDSQTVSYSRANFGQRPFTYTPPSGFSALNTQNLPTPTIAAGNKYFDVVTRVGVSGTGGSITSLNFQPDFIWDKPRNGGTTAHYLNNSVTGVGNYLNSNTASVEGAISNFITAFNANGFSLGTADWANTYNVVDWCWNAGGSTIAGTGTGGITNVSYRANPTAGFSVVIYTGSGAAGTVTHGLGAAPVMILNKGRNTAYNWHVYFSTLGTGDFEGLNTTSAYSSASNWFNNAAVTATTIPVGASQGTATYVCYCFAPVASYSSFGSFVGNGSSDGPMVFTNFRPRYLLVKASSTTGDWVVIDTSRSPYNVSADALYANGNFAEDNNVTNRSVDFLSNGFKIRSSGTFINTSGATYIYAAFAENPFKNSRAR